MTSKSETDSTEASPQQQQSYKGFGSFHSDNVQDLIQLPKEKYVAPPVPEFARSLNITKAEFEFGKGARKFFRMSPEWTFINHGAFGGALTEGVSIKRQYEDLMEDQPLTFVDRTLLPLLVYSARSIADFIHATPADVALVPNATFGLNAAIFGMIESTDVVAYLDTEYGSVWRMLLEKCERVGANLNEIPLGRYFHDETLFGSDEAVTEYIRKALPAGLTTIVIDHIASNGAFELPIFTHIIPMLRSQGVKNIIVDGAHGPLQCPLDFDALPKEQRPSVYVGNLHKWFSGPKSVGFIWAHEGKVKSKIRSPVVSHGFNSGYFSEFVWNGTTDYGAHLAVPAVVDFWTNVVGVQKARDYCTDLLTKATTLLEKRFKSVPMARRAPFMTLVQLPPFLNNPKKFSSKYIQDTLHYQYQVEVPVKHIEGNLYYRLSAFVYNTLEDYARLAEVTESLIRQHRKRNRDTDDEDGDIMLGDPEESGAANDDRETSEGGCAAPDNGCGVGLLGSSTRQVQFEDSDDDAQ